MVFCHQVMRTGDLHTSVQVILSLSLSSGTSGGMAPLTHSLYGPTKHFFANYGELLFFKGTD